MSFIVIIYTMAILFLWNCPSYFAKKLRQILSHCSTGLCVCVFVVAVKKFSDFILLGKSVLFRSCYFLCTNQLQNSLYNFYGDKYLFYWFCCKCASNSIFVSSMKSQSISQEDRKIASFRMRFSFKPNCATQLNTFERDCQVIVSQKFFFLLIHFNT